MKYAQRSDVHEFMHRGLKYVIVVGVALIAVAVAASTASAASYKTCRASTVDDLKAKRISCSTAERLYRTSLRRCGPDNMSGPRCDPFKFTGLRWACRAYTNRKGVNWTWRCAASGNRAMQYRWLAGD